MKRMEGFTLREELSSDLWRATSEDGVHVLVKFPKHSSLSALALCRREYEMGCKLKDIRGVHSPVQVLEGNDLVGLLYEDCGGELFSNYLSSFCARLSLDFDATLQDFLSIAINLARLLEEIHYKGVILGVVQPDDIILGPNGVLLFDFSRATAAPSNNPSELAGSDLRYISPEATGRTQHNVDTRSDLYSLGATLYHLITGRAPFQFDTAAALVYAHIAKKPTDVIDLSPNVPEVLSQIIGKLLNKSPVERYQYGLKWDLEQCHTYIRDHDMRVFPLGSHDKMRKFTLPTQLFGRSNELSLLRGVFDKVAQGESSLVFISGHSGIGKTALIQTAQLSVPPPRFLYISGKFDQVNKFIPYSAFLQAATDLLRQLLAMSEDMVEMYKIKIIEALGANAQVIIEVVPLLELIIGPHDPVPDLPPIESQTRFDTAFQEFLQVFAQRESPMILFLDDLQWADSSTLRLLRLLGSKDATAYIVIISAYRDNEVLPTYATGKTIAECKATVPNLLNIELRPLNIKTLNELVNSAFPATNTSALAEIVLKKTEGNPFFVLQFLKTIHHEGLLHFEPQNQTWFWDLAQINTVCSTSNVVEFMVQTLSKLEHSTQNAMLIAACLGNKFNIEVLSLACDQTVQKTASDLDNALRGEYVIRLDDTGFKFVHDRVQQAALNLCQESERAEKQLEIGRRLIKGLTKNNLDQYLFDVVSLLNFGSALVTSKEEKIEVAKFNYQAGLRAKSTAAFGPALMYMQTADELLNNDIWTTDYAFMFAFKLALCECEFLSGVIETAEEIAHDTLSRANTRSDKCSVYKLLVQQYAIAGDYKKSVGFGLTCLDILYGIKVSMEPTPEEVAAGYKEVKESLMALTNVSESLASAPDATDVGVQESFQLGGALIAASFFLSIDLLTVFLSRMLVISIKEGNTPQSPMVMIWFAAFVAGSRYEDFQLGYDLGKVALSLNEKYKEPASTMVGFFLFGDFINYWKSHLSTDIAYLQKSYKGALDVGDQGYACYSSCHLYAVNLMIATPLPEALSFMDPSSSFVHSTKYGELDDVHITLKTSILVAQELGVEAFDEPYYHSLEERLTTRSACAQSYHFIFKMMVQCILGDFEGATITAQRSEQVLPGCFGHCFRVYHFFFYNIALAETHSPGSPDLDRVFQIMEANHKEIKVYSDVSEENFFHLFLMSQAGIEKLKGNFVDALELLGTAAESASAGGFTRINNNS